MLFREACTLYKANGGAPINIGLVVKGGEGEEVFGEAREQKNPTKMHKTIQRLRTKIA